MVTSPLPQVNPSMYWPGPVRPHPPADFLEGFLSFDAMS